MFFLVLECELLWKPESYLVLKTVSYLILVRFEECRTFYKDTRIECILKNRAYLCFVEYADTIGIINSYLPLLLIKVMESYM